MATAEFELFNREFSRRSLVLPFARRGKPKVRQPVIARIAVPQTPLQPPNRPGIDRRTLIWGGLTVAGLGVGAAILEPWKVFLPSEQKKGREWQSLPPSERIRRLEFRQYPNLTNFDSTGEMVQASAEYFCNVINCSPSSLVNQTSFVNAQRIIEEIEYDSDRPLSEEEKSRIGEETVEIYSGKRKLILINSEHLERETKKFLNANNSAAIGDRYAYAVMLKSVLFHTFTHSVMQQEGFQFPDITVPSSTPLIYNKLESGFIFSGRTTDGTRIFSHGGDEAITDYIATAIGQNTGPFVGGPNYISGVRLVEMLNIRAKIPLADFIDYCIGRKPKRDLFRRWGALKNTRNPDEQAALMAFLIITLRVDDPEIITQDQAIMEINKLLTP